MGKHTLVDIAGRDTQWGNAVVLLEQHPQLATHLALDTFAHKKCNLRLTSHLQAQLLGIELLVEGVDIHAILGCSLGEYLVDGISRDYA